MVVIVDYNMGNLGSLANMLAWLGVQVRISADRDEISQADKLILPGVGAFDTGMQNLKDLGLLDVLNCQVLEKRTPVLGVCLGMQLLGSASEEGSLAGLGWIKANSLRFNFSADQKLKVPHMGWNSLTVIKDHYLLSPILDKAMFYFVHSYHICCEEPADILATSVYGHEFVACVAKDNIMGTQFHPEKSLKYGMQILGNFCRGRIS